MRVSYVQHVCYSIPVSKSSCLGGIICNSKMKPLLCQQNTCIGMINHNLFIFKRVFPPYNLKDYKSSRGTRHLFNRAHEEVAVQIAAPATGALGQLLALCKCLLIGVVVAFDNVRRLVVEVGLVVQSLEAAVVYVLDFGEGVLDQLRGNGGRDACQ